MTTHYLKHCSHCGSGYAYQASGPGADDYNSGTHCQFCQKVIIDALSHYPRLFERRHRPTTDCGRIYYNGRDYDLSFVTVDIAKEWDKRFWAEAKGKQQRGNSLFPPMQRIFPGLFKTMPNGEIFCKSIREVRGYDGFQGLSFILSTWPPLAGETDDSVEIGMEYDLVNKCWTGKVWL